MHNRIIIEKGLPLNEAKKAIIILHGRGGNAENILQLAENFSDETFYLVAPQATNNTWYPFGFMADEHTNEPWLSDAVNWITDLIENTAKVIGTENIYLMGFSQGACLSLEVAARYGKPLAGIASFTGGLIGQTLVYERYKGNFNQTKVYIANSDNDPHVPLQRSNNSKVILESMGALVTLEVFDGRHHLVSDAEIASVKRLLF